MASGLLLNDATFRDRKLRVTKFRGTVQKKIHELASKSDNPKRKNIQDKKNSAPSQDKKKFKPNQKFTPKAAQSMNPALRRKAGKSEKKI